MKATDFVKKYGWDESTAFLSLDGDVEIVYTASFFDELKRLVESHKLVENVGGLDEAKMLLRVRIAAELYDSADEIEKAITDVESCL